MRLLGVVLICIGLMGGCSSMLMETSTGSTYNIGLIDQRQRVLLISGLLAIAGVLFFGFGVLANQKSGPAEADGERRPCPFCAERILEAAQECRFCHRQVILPRVAGEREATALLYGLDQARTILGMDVRQLDEVIANGDLKTVQVGEVTLCTDASIARVMARSRQGG